MQEIEYTIGERKVVYSDAIMKGGFIVATSSLFASVTITDPEKSERFIRALEASEKAAGNRPAKESVNITFLRDTDSIRKLVEKRKTVK